MNKLIKYIFFILLVFCLRSETSAQPGSMPYNNAPSFRDNRYNRPNSFRKLEAIKNAYINKRLSLTPEEADRFWPLYNQYQSELSDVLRQRRLNNSSQQANGMDQVNRDIYYEQQLLAIRKKYRDEFLRILPPDKVSTLYKSEREFKDELIKQLGERKPQR